VVASISAVVYDCNTSTAKKYTMLTLDQIKAALSDRRIKMVAQATGLHNNTIRDIRDNPKANPSYRVMKALSDYLEVVEKA
jgi:hypothetical protein